jgi:hypothetical protein
LIKFESSRNESTVNGVRRGEWRDGEEDLLDGEDRDLEDGEGIGVDEVVDGVDGVEIVVGEREEDEVGVELFLVCVVGTKDTTCTFELYILNDGDVVETDDVMFGLDRFRVWLACVGSLCLT